MKSTGICTCTNTNTNTNTNSNKATSRIHKNVVNNGIDNVDYDYDYDDAITLAETVIHDNDNESVFSYNNNNNNNNNSDTTMTTIINNIDNDNNNNNKDKKEEWFIQDFIRENIVRDMNDLVLFFMILTKCTKSNVFTERQRYGYTVQALLQALTIIDRKGSSMKAKAKEEEGEEDIFNTIIDLVMEQDHLFSSEYKDSDELKTFLRITQQNKNNEQHKGEASLQQDDTMNTKEELKNKVDRIEEYLVRSMKRNNDSVDHVNTNHHQILEKTDTFRIQAFCGIASLFLNTVASNYCFDSDDNDNNNNTDSDAIVRLLTEMTFETTLQELSSSSSSSSILYKIINFGDKEQISRGIQACITGHEEIMGDIVQSSIDYVNNLDLDWLLGGEDAASTMTNSFLLKNRDRVGRECDGEGDGDRDNNHEIQDSMSIIETVVKLQVTMIHVNLVQLDEQSNDINSIVKIMTDHPCIASIQERGCEKLANFSTNDKVRDAISYEESQTAANAVVDAMNRHEDISNVQSFGVAAMISLRAAMIPNDPVTNVNGDKQPQQATCFSKILKLCCLEA